MANFNIPVGMKCTEKEFNSSFIGGKSLRLLLEEEGYDLSELRFTKPFLVNFYKKAGDKIGTTETPFTFPGRHVVQYWDENFFYAICCQREYEAITVGEFFTTADNSIFQCTGIDKDWLKVGPKAAKQPVFNRSVVHKSTYEELSDFYDLIRNRGDREDVPVVSVKPNAVKKHNSAAMETDQYPLKQNPDRIPAPQLIRKEDFENTLTVEESFDVLKTLDEAKKTGMFPGEQQAIRFTMTPQQLFEAMLNDSEVFLGFTDQTGCKCIGYKIKMISTKSVYLETGHEHSAQPIDSFYENLEKFHLHALQKLAQSKK